MTLSLSAASAICWQMSWPWHRHAASRCTLAVRSPTAAITAMHCAKNPLWWHPNCTSNSCHGCAFGYTLLRNYYAVSYHRLQLRVNAGNANAQIAQSHQLSVFSQLLKDSTPGVHKDEGGVFRTPFLIGFKGERVGQPPRFSLYDCKTTSC